MKLSKKEKYVLIVALYNLCNLEMTEINKADREEYKVASNLIDKLERITE